MLVMKTLTSMALLGLGSGVHVNDEASIVKRNLDVADSETFAPWTPPQANKAAMAAFLKYQKDKKAATEAQPKLDKDKAVEIKELAEGHKELLDTDKGNDVAAAQKIKQKAKSMKQFREEETKIRKDLKRQRDSIIKMLKEEDQEKFKLADKQDKEQREKAMKAKEGPGGMTYIVPDKEKRRAEENAYCHFPSVKTGEKVSAKDVFSKTNDDYLCFVAEGANGHCASDSDMAYDFPDLTNCTYAIVDGVYEGLAEQTYVFVMDVPKGSEESTGVQLAMASCYMAGSYVNQDSVIFRNPMDSRTTEPGLTWMMMTMDPDTCGASSEKAKCELGRMKPGKNNQAATRLRETSETWIVEPYGPNKEKQEGCYCELHPTECGINGVADEDAMKALGQTGNVGER